jgi:hypothetical protein
MDEVIMQLHMLHSGGSSSLLLHSTFPLTSGSGVR